MTLLSAYPRRADWAERLQARLETLSSAPLDYRVHDCARLVFAAIDAVLGVDCLHPATPPPVGLAPWDGVRAAAAAWRAHGGLVGALDARLAPVSPARALRGDVGLAWSGRRLVGVVATADGLAAVGRVGLVVHPRTLLARAYAVGVR